MLSGKYKALRQSTALRKLGKCLDLTKEIRTEFSEILYDTAVVSKGDRPKNDLITVALALGLTMTVLPKVAFDPCIDKDKKYRIHLHGKNVYFCLDNIALFNALETGDRALVSYAEVYRVTRDYSAPNFGHKTPLEGIFVGHKFLSAKKV